PAPPQPRNSSPAGSQSTTSSLTTPSLWVCPWFVLVTRSRWTAPCSWTPRSSSFSGYVCWSFSRRSAETAISVAAAGLDSVAASRAARDRGSRARIRARGSLDLQDDDGAHRDAARIGRHRDLEAHYGAGGDVGDVLPDPQLEACRRLARCDGPCGDDPWRSER